jgi:hypothetical protein
MGSRILYSSESVLTAWQHSLLRLSFSAVGQPLSAVAATVADSRGVCADSGATTLKLSTVRSGEALAGGVDAMA